MPASLLLTPELSASLASAVRAGIPIETATQASGISQQTFYEWLRVGESGVWATGDPVSPQSRLALLAFTDEIRRAQADHETMVLERIGKAVDAVNEKTGIPEWRAGAWLLNNHPRYRSRYRPHREVEHSGVVNVLHEHKQAAALPDAAIDAAFAALPDAT